VKARHAPAVVVRRFAAGRGPSLRVAGTGAPSRRPFTLLAALAATAFAVLALGAPLAAAAAPEAPEVFLLESEPAIGSSSALIFGVLQPGQSGGGQEPLTWQFLFKQSTTECTGGSSTPAQNSNGNGHQEVAELVEGLSPDTQYTVCLRAENAAAEASVSAPLTFRTLQPAETPEATPATQITAHTAQLNGVLSPHSTGNPPGSTERFFIFGASETGCPEEHRAGFGLSGGGEAEPVTQAIEELAPATTYGYCLVDHVPFEAEAVSAPGFFTTAAAAPSVLGGTALEVGTSTATLGAQITADGLATTYFVEYVTEAQFQAGGFSGAAVAPVPPAELPGSAFSEPVQVTLNGLSPVTVYRFRFQAENGLGSSPAGPEGHFATTAPQGPLPDGRAAELVSTAGIFGEPYIQTSPNSFSVIGLNRSFYPFQAAAEGEAVTYVGESAEAGGNGNTGNALGEQWLATRTPEGWTTRAIGPEASIGREESIATYQAFSEDLSQGVLIGSANPLTPEVPVGCRALYSRATATGDYRALFNLDESPEPGAVAPCGNPLFAGAGKDGSQTIFQSKAALTHGAVRATNPLGDGALLGCEFHCNLYEAVGGHLLPVNVLGGHPVPDASFGGFPGEAEAEHELPDLSGAISEDGSRIFWTDTEPGPDFEHVYVFEDGATNVQVSGSGPARYWTATPDGRYAYYTEEGELWRFDTDEGSREALAGPGSAVLGVIGVNQVRHDEGEPDGNYLYFVAEGIPLATNEVENGNGPEEAEEGRPNLYLIHDGVTSFIATLSPQDDAVKVDEPFIGGDWKGALGLRTAAVSPDGRNLVFESGRPLTGYANSSAQVPTPVREAFVYSAADGRLVCASCQPSGLSPSVSELERGEPRLPVSLASSTYIHRWMSADGNRVFFDSEQPLSPLDTNGIQDVYEWERQGEGGCTSADASPFNDGCVFLLSGGDSPGYSFLIDADEEGDNVFLEHLGPLGQVKAPPGSNELYDLRVGGGFEEAASAACSGEGCRGPLASPPSVKSAGTAGFQANEPSPPVKCKKGKVKKKGKCVAKKSHTKKHHKKSNKKKGKKQRPANSNHGVGK
jgi:hypothetical protein